MFMFRSSRNSNRTINKMDPEMQGTLGKTCFSIVKASALCPFKTKRLRMSIFALMYICQTSKQESPMFVKTPRTITLERFDDVL